MILKSLTIVLNIYYISCLTIVLYFYFYTSLVSKEIHTQNYMNLVKIYSGPQEISTAIRPKLVRFCASHSTTYQKHHTVGEIVSLACVMRCNGTISRGPEYRIFTTLRFINIIGALGIS